MPSIISVGSKKKLTANESSKTLTEGYDNLHTGRTFLRLVETERIDAASEMLADGFFYTSATFNAGKDEWLSRTTRKASTTKFGELKVLNDYQAVRRGTRKLGFITLRVKEILEFDDEGKIERISRL